MGWKGCSVSSSVSGLLMAIRLLVWVWYNTHGRFLPMDKGLSLLCCWGGRTANDSSGKPGEAGERGPFCNLASTITSRPV